MSDRWLNAPTVDLSLIPPVTAKQLPNGNLPPNMPPSTRYRNMRADITHEPPEANADGRD
jgi:hypothetical protein